MLDGVGRADVVVDEDIVEDDEAITNTFFAAHTFKFSTALLVVLFM
jgi:hypothetical protein